jgi:RNAse (barnase) inhibitor barstar
VILIARENELPELPETGNERVELPGEAADRDALFDELSVALSLPEYFGHNWDAFEECLDERTPPDLVVWNARALWQQLPRELSVLVEIWLEKAPESILIFVW